jgi:hypothetical protein
VGVIAVIVIGLIWGELLKTCVSHDKQVFVFIMTKKYLNVTKWRCGIVAKPFHYLAKFYDGTYKYLKSFGIIEI